MDAAEREADATGRNNPDRRLFAEQLRGLREQRGWTRDELAAMIGHTASTIANIETCYRPPTRDQALALDRAFELPRFFERIEARMHGAPFSAGFRSFVPFEGEATTLRIFENMIMPGLLQTEDYARTILAVHPDVTPQQVEDRTNGRMDRQRIITRETPAPPRLWVVLDKSVLTREIGSPKIMHDQVSRLLELAALPNVTIQVLTETCHCALNGAFNIASGQGQTVGYIETVIDGTTMEDAAVVAELELKFDVLRTDAQRPKESLATLERTMEEWTN